MNAASLGDTALQSSDPTTATLHYTTALLTHPRSPSYFIKRSTAFSRLKPTPNLPAALCDAESAVLLARERGKRELIVEAQMRRAIVLFLMGRYVAAEGVVGVVERMVGLDREGSNGEDKEEKVRRAMGGAAAGAAGKGVEAEVRIWGAKIRAKVQGLGGNGDGEGEGDKVEEVPVGVKVPGEKELRAQLEELRGEGKSKSTVGGVTEKEGGQKVEDKAEKEEEEEKAEVKEAQQQQQQQQVKVRHEWYQSGETVVVTLYVKGVPKDKVAIELKEDSVCTSPTPHHLDLLYNNILIILQDISPIPPPLRRRIRLHPRPALRPHRPLHLEDLRLLHQDRNLSAQEIPRPEMERPGIVYRNYYPACYNYSCTHHTSQTTSPRPIIPYLLPPRRQRLG